MEEGPRAKFPKASECTVITSDGSEIIAFVSEKERRPMGNQRFQAKIRRSEEVFCDGVLGYGASYVRRLGTFRCLTLHSRFAMMAR
jgi:hypothetical protein